MNTRKSFLLSLALTGLFACTGAEPDAERCNTDKCDDLQSSVGKLMPRAPEAPGTISVSRNDNQWLFEVIGSKGEIVLLSEDYSDKSAALNGMLSVEENGVLLERYEVSQNGPSWSFVLRAGNNEVIADSQSFAGEAEARQAVEASRELIAGIVQYRAALDQGAGFALNRDDNKWEFSLSDDAGESLLQSQVYSGRTDALTGIASVRKNGKEAARYRVLDSPPRFILKAANGEEIGASKSFSTLSEAEASMASTQALLASERVANPW